MYSLLEDGASVLGVVRTLVRHNETAPRFRVTNYLNRIWASICPHVFGTLRNFMPFLLWTTFINVQNLTTDATIESIDETLSDSAPAVLLSFRFKVPYILTVR